MWDITEDDRRLMALEEADRLNDEPPPDWYDRDENEDLAVLEAANNCLDPDYEAKFRDAMKRCEEADQLDAIALELWGGPTSVNIGASLPPSQPISTIGTMLSTADKYFPVSEANQTPAGLVPQTPQQALPENVTSTPESPPDDDINETNTKRIQAYQVAQDLLEREIILISRNAIYYFDGRVYRLMTKEDTQRLIVDRCRDAVAASGTTSLIDNVYKHVFLEPRINTRDIDPSPDEVVFLDGVLDLNTMRLMRHSSSTFSTRLVQANYGKGSHMACPHFDRFVQGIADGNPDLERRIWQALGYLLVQDHRGKCFILLQGVRDSGKSVFGRFVQSLFDQDAISGLELHSLDGNFSKSDLIGKSLWLDLDLPSGALRGRAASELKKITGGDLLSADIKYMPRASFVNRAKILFATNHPVLTDSTDEAFERRMIVIPFARTIPQDKQDFGLDAKLQSEKDAVAAKAIHYFLDLRKNKYIFAGNFPANCAVSAGEDLISKIFLFLTDFCEEADEWTPTETLYAAFSSIFGPVCNKRNFSERFHLCSPSIYPNIGRKRDRIDSKGNPLYGYMGIRLRSNSNKEEQHG